MSHYVETLIEIAKKEIGYLEKASNKNLDSKTGNAGDNNYTKYARDLDAIPDFYNGKKNGYPWCDVFVDWCFVEAFGTKTAKEMLCQPNDSLGASCTYSANYYKKKGMFETTPQIGDQVFFLNSSKKICHTGIVIDIDKNYIYTIEGNTSSASGVVDNGGAVAKKKYKKSYNKIAGYGRHKFDKKEVEYIPTVLEWQQAAIKDGFKFPKAGADGKWGSECRSVVKKTVVKRRPKHKYPNLTKLVQKVVGVEMDGKCGPKTEAAIKTYQKNHKLKVDGSCGPATWKEILQVD